MRSSLRFLAIATIITLSGFFRSQAAENTAALNALNALTYRPVSLQVKGKLSSIGKLVQTIAETNTVPYKSYLEIKGKSYRVVQGVQLFSDDSTVFIFSRGYALRKKVNSKDYFLQRGAGAFAGYLQYENNIVADSPLVSFDYDDSRQGFSFGQDNDIEALKTVYDAILKQNPHINIVLIGDCRGAKVALELAAQNPKNLKALILFSPFVSAQAIINQMAKSYLSYLPYSKHVLANFLQRFCPLYDPKKDDLATRINRIDKNLPIFIGQRKSDTVIPNEGVRELAKVLKKNGNKNVHGLLVHDPSERHSKIYLNKKIQRRVNDFLHQYGLPYSVARISK